ncbi:hypothetical protein [Emticicia sp. SJ17W-69]|uniref:hypothetical protein n=1 Tax=Emticicia sp. SJ17W-69 TaxID=3421657 RepID=UPI003EBCC6FE
MKESNSFFLKFFEVFFTILVLIGLSQISNAAGQYQWKVVNDATLIWRFCGGILLLSGILAFLWQKFIQNPKLHIWLQTIITFYVAFEITTYGSAKILKTQFQAPNYILDTPIGDLNGFWITWTYFGYSQTLALILGLIQVSGCILLLFRKTRSLAIMILLPVMVNIDLIDHFYKISPLAYYNALHYTFMLTFLLFLDYEKLKEAFFSYQESWVINWKSIGLNLLRVLVIGGAFWQISKLRNEFQPKTAINGVWKVEEITQKNKTIIPTVVRDSVWSKIYFEWRYGCIFKYNPDKFNDKKDLNGDYKVNEAKKELTVNFYKEDGSKGDSLLLNYQIKDSTMVLNGKYMKDSLVMKLKRLK